MSKSKRESNYRKEERRFEDGDKREFIHEYREHKYEKKLKNIDWIFIATPDKTHFKLVKKFLLKKINVFCEKPLTLKFKQSIELFKIAKKNKVKLYVDDIQIFLKKKIILKKKNYILIFIIINKKKKKKKKKTKRKKKTKKKKKKTETH